VKRLLDRTPDDAQHLLFSATLDKGVDVIVKRYMSDPVTHSVDSEQSPVNTMTHHVLHVTNDDRLPVIIDLAAAPGRTIIFTRTKHRAKQLTRQLNAHGVVSVEMHGNLSQNVRTRNLAAFSDGTAAAMVATDIAARGIHVDDISLVIHADPPMEHKAYLHRSGRTARAGNEGVVVTLATESQRKDTDQLMRKAGIKPTVTKVRPDSPLLQEIAPGQRLKKSASEVKAMLDVPEPAKTPGGRPNSRNPRSATPSASGRPKRGGPSSGRRGSGSGASSGSGSSARSGSGSSSRSGSGGGSRSGAGSSSSSRSGSGSGGGGRSSGGGGSSAGSRQGSSRSAGRQGGRAR
jgi:superfamily II DNA/RNA helicase